MHLVSIMRKLEHTAQEKKQHKNRDLDHSAFSSTQVVQPSHKVTRCCLPNLFFPSSHHDKPPGGWSRQGLPNAYCCCDGRQHSFRPQNNSMYKHSPNLHTFHFALISTFQHSLLLRNVHCLCRIILHCINISLEEAFI